MKRYTVVVTVEWAEYKPASEVADLIEEATTREAKYLRSLRRI